MTKQTINIGTTANDKSGDPLRTAFSKVNANFDELYSAVSADVQIPSQTGNNGKFLTTNGGTLSWSTALTSVPVATNTSVGAVKPDNHTIVIDGNGAISALHEPYTELTYTDPQDAYSQKYVRIGASGADISFYTVAGLVNQWTFGTDGRLTVPGGIRGQALSLSAYTGPTPGASLSVNQTNFQLSIASSNYTIDNTGITFPDSTKQTTAWRGIDNAVPSQSGNNGKYLTTNGSTVSWGSSLNPFDQTLNSSDSVKFNTISGPAINSGLSVTTYSQSGETITPYTWTFDTDGILTFPGGMNISTEEGGDTRLIIAGGSNFIDLRSNGTILIGYNSTGSVQIGNPEGGTTTEIVSEKVKFLLQSVPTSSVGAAGDTPGLIAFDASYIYYCAGTYNGVDNIWKRIAWGGGTW